MKRFYASLLPFYLSFIFFTSCKNEQSLSPKLGKATFSLWPKTKGGGRIKETVIPAFVLLSIKNSNGKLVQENKKFPLFAFGLSYISEELQLHTDTYQLTQFAVLDAANKVIYATPLEGSNLAKYVNDPLLISFGISENQNTQVIPQVLAVLNNDTPESFGLASFGFEVVKVIAWLHSEEYFMYDPTTDGFVGSFKKIYTYDQDKLIQINGYDYDPTTNSYDPGYKYQEYHYDSKGKLARKINFVGDNGIKFIHEYEYLSDEKTKVTRQEYYNSYQVGSPDWWIMEKGPSSLTVKYYQGNNELYQELNYEMDGMGNVISVVANPPFPGGKIYYKYDDSPNPNRFPELGGEYGVDTEKYLSQNNMVGQANEPNPKSNKIIEYNKEGYPVVIISGTVKRVLNYQ